MIGNRYRCDYNEHNISTKCDIFIRGTDNRWSCRGVWPLLLLWRTAGYCTKIWTQFVIINQYSVVVNIYWNLHSWIMEKCLEKEHARSVIKTSFHFWCQSLLKRYVTRYIISTIYDMTLGHMGMGVGSRMLK